MWEYNVRQREEWKLEDKHNQQVSYMCITVSMSMSYLVCGHALDHALDNDYSHINVRVVYCTLQEKNVMPHSATLKHNTHDKINGD